MPTEDPSPIDYRPSTLPGRHLPHVWLTHSESGTAETPVSTLDLVSTTSFTLFTDAAGAEGWRAAAAAQAWPVRLIVVSDDDREWAEVRDVGAGGAILVRPDRKVAWRSATRPADPAEALTGALQAILGGGFALDDDPAEPFLERIRNAAGLLVRRPRTGERGEEDVSEDVEQTDEAIRRLGRLDACAVSDALDTLELPGATTGIRALWAAPERVVGRARTVTAGRRQSDGPADHIAASAIDAAGVGDVLVIANGGRLDVSCFGGLLTLAASTRGLAGVVIDGACRDIAESEELEFPVFGRAVVPVSARGRVVQIAMGEPVFFADVTVTQGDYVIADSNGVVFVPASRIDDVLELAERIVEREAGMAEAVRAGQPVAEVMHDSRFPTVQAVAR
ncbi:RraA family protein [Herbiconiux daphne]|uniref:RraA family protein n=1 Tax=Herbiconiux daphne TaxID=2970914 RepID=UPI0038B2C91C